MSVASLAGCSTQTALSAGRTGKPVSGGDLTYLDAEAPVSFQLQGSGTWQDSAVVHNVTDRLVFHDPKSLELKPWIASKWEISPDGTVYTFTIRDGVTYSDGSPLDAESVKRNLLWQATGDQAKGITRSTWFPHVTSVTADNGTGTVVVTLAERFSPFLAVLSFWRSGLVSDATIDASLDQQKQPTHLIGSGPFVVTSYTYGKQLVLTKRKKYDWAPPSLAHQGEAYLDTVTIIPVQEDSVRLGTLTSNQADAMRYVEPSEEAGLTKAGFRVIGIQGIGDSNVWVTKATAEFMDDVNVRRAVLLGIDRKGIVGQLYTKNWKAATNVEQPRTLGWKDNSAKLAYNPEEAKRLLDASGFTGTDSAGYRTKNGKRLEIITYVDVFDHTAKPLFQLIQYQLKKIGIHLDVKETDYSSISEVSTDPTVGVLRNGWPEPDPYSLNVSYHSTLGDSFKLKGSDSKLDALLDAHVTAVGDDERATRIEALQDYIIDQAYAIPILDDSQVFVLQPHVQGFNFTAEARPSYYDTWISK